MAEPSPSEPEAPRLAPAPVAGRGELVETIGGRPRLLRLRVGELEQIEEALKKGVYAIQESFFERGERLSSHEVKVIVAHALMGGGAPAWEANRLMNEIQADELVRLYRIAQGAFGVALFPDLADEEDAEEEKKTPSTSSEATSPESGDAPSR